MILFDIFMKNTLIFIKFIYLLFDVIYRFIIAIEYSIMNRSKTTVEEIIGILDNRLQDISSLNRQNTQRNTMTVIESINDKENQRLRQMGKLELMVN